MRFLRHILSVLLLACSFVTASFAGEVPASPIAKTRLAIASDARMAAVVFDLPPHWHIYWQNPGDSGISPTFHWTLPQNAKAGEILWPTPKRFAMGDIINYGYGDQVTLLVPLENAAHAKGTATLNAKWLVCEEICIPESAILTATLPSDDPDADALIAHAHEQLPVTLDGDAAYFADATKVMLQLKTQHRFSRDAQFFPLDDGIILNSGTASLAHGDGIVQFQFARGDAEMLPTLAGVIRDDAGGYQIVAQRSTTPFEPVQNMALLPILLLALAGGVLLNLMPCVLPILSLKALALVKKSGAAPQHARAQGVYYTLGVIGGFLVIAILALLLKSIGMSVGWGFQLQQPAFVAVLIALMVLVALNLLGRFEVPVLLGSVTVSHQGNRGAFLTGLLAVALATPCTTPFMAPALGATLLLPDLVSLAVFASLGFGMALPFLVISHWPAALRLLPKPGAWMERFKRWMALPVLATALWLASVQLSLNGTHGVLLTTAGIAIITILIVVRRIPTLPRWLLIAAAVTVIALAQPTVSSEAPAATLTHEAFDPQRLQTLRDEGVPVFVNATADWCITCKFNENVALKTEKVSTYFEKHRITYMVADWTRNDPKITAHLHQFQRTGVPLYVYYPPHKEPVVLPQLLTPSTVIQTLSQP